MDWVSALLLFGAFFGGLWVVSRVLRWAVGLVETYRESASAGRGKSPADALIQLFLHSGPWYLVIAIIVAYRAASEQSERFWAILVGSGPAVVVVACAAALAHSRHQRLATAPLTAERLAKIRRRFYWIHTFVFGGASAALLLYSMWPQLVHSVALIAYVIVACVFGGLINSWFLWQFYGGLLESREEARRWAERNDAV